MSFSENDNKLPVNVDKYYLESKEHSVDEPTHVAVRDTQILITLKNHLFLQTIYFINESVATEQFYKIQRERKIWWMKFLTNPGRLSLTNLKNENSLKSVSITSKFHFGDLNIENIELIPLQSLKLENLNDFLDKYNKTVWVKKKLPVIIKSEINLNLSCLGLLFDAVDETKNDRMLLHRKIVPYQCSIFCLAQDEQILIELDDLAAHLVNVVRRAKISLFTLKTFRVLDEKCLNVEMNQMDKIGVPYCIILEEETLKDGLMRLRNRDTTIFEIIHLTDIPNYLLKIFNVHL